MIDSVKLLADGGTSPIVQALAMIAQGVMIIIGLIIAKKSKG